MAERIDGIARKSRSLGILLGVALAIFGGMVLAAGFGLSRGADVAHAQVNPTFDLCKEWLPEGAIDPSAREFTFSVSDTSETVREVVIEVGEGDPMECTEIVAPPGEIQVTEIVPDGFVTPDWFIDEDFDFGGTSETAFFILGLEDCEEIPLMQTMSVAANCVVLFSNQEIEEPPPTVTVTVTTTPPPTVCARCNAVTPPPPTSTPVPPTATPAPNTPVPPTATPTTSTGTQSPGLTDEQRTATAVAGAKTAAAAVTPIAPKTGVGGPGSSESALHLSLAIAGLLVLGTGLGLIGAKNRR